MAEYVMNECISQINEYTYHFYRLKCWINVHVGNEGMSAKL